MNYGMDDVLVAWAGVARAANPAQGLRTAMERSTFAGLFDSDVHFAALGGRAADVGATAEATPSSAEGSSIGEVPVAVRSVAEYALPVLAPPVSRPVLPGPDVVEAGAGQVTAPGSLVRLVNVPEGNAAGRSPARVMLEPALFQWSRTAVTACLRDGELNLAVRDGTLEADRETLDVLTRALREMGLELAKLKINGINAGA